MLDAWLRLGLVVGLLPKLNFLNEDRTPHSVMPQLGAEQLERPKRLALWGAVSEPRPSPRAP